MLESMFQTSDLLFQSQRVIGLRLAKLSIGGREDQREAFQMIDEKVKASIDSSRILMAGGSSSMVLAHYSKLVADNVKRLSATTRLRTIDAAHASRCAMDKRSSE